MKTKAILFFVMIFGVFTYSVLAQEEIKPIQLTDNLYALTDIPGGNIAFLVTDEGVLVVDAGNLPRDGEKIVEIIKEITDQPIKYLILTHLHGDHTNGIAGFPDDVTTIAHKSIIENAKNNNEPRLENLIQNTIPQRIAEIEKEISELEAQGSEEISELKKQLEELTIYLEDAKRIKPVNPSITFDESYTIELGDENIKLNYPGEGHTLCNITVTFENHNTIHTGDLIFINMSPYSIPEHGANISNWISILDRMNEHKYDHVIPGHGALTNNKGIQDQSEYFKILWDKVKNLKNEGFSLEEIQTKIDDGTYDNLDYKGQLASNIALIFKELDN